MHGGRRCGDALPPETVDAARCWEIWQIQFLDSTKLCLSLGIKFLEGTNLHEKCVVQIKLLAEFEIYEAFKKTLCQCYHASVLNTNLLPRLGFVDLWWPLS